MKYRIFIVEDDETIANLLKKHLSSWGYEVFLAEDFSNVLQEFAGKDPQLVLLDLKLPFYNGFHWCEEIRKVSQVPVIFISSAADNMNMVMAMSRGADDFIAKPFDMDVLVAKIQAILRRTYSFGNPGDHPETGQYADGRGNRPAAFPGGDDGLLYHVGASD